MVRDIHSVAPYQCIIHRVVPGDLLLNFGGGINYTPSE